MPIAPITCRRILKSAKMLLRMLVVLAGVGVSLVACGGGGGGGSANISTDAPTADAQTGCARPHNVYAPFLSTQAIFPGASRISAHMAEQRALFSIVRDGATVTVNYRSGPETVHEPTRWFHLAEIRQAVRGGDVIRIVELRSPGRDFNVGDDYTVLVDSTTLRASYSDEPRNENRFLATLVKEGTCEPAAEGQFAVFPDDGEDAWVTEGGFALRDGLRGLIDEQHAVRLDNFLFTADARLTNFHLERRWTPLQYDNFTLHADGGYKRWDNGATGAFYAKTTARLSLTPTTDAYLQVAAGTLSSSVYRDSRLRGFAVGVFHDSLFRRDDSYHLRIEQPFAAEALAATRIALAARVGVESHYAGLSFYHHLRTDAHSGRVFYRRTF